MAGFIRRFTLFPTLAQILEIEGVVIIDDIPPGIFTGRASGVVCLVGEWPKGPFNTPTVVEGDQTIQGTFGGFSLSMRNPLSPSTNPYSNGCAFTWLKAKAFRKLVLVRADVTSVLTVKIRLTGTPTPLTADLTIPAGTRIFDASAPTCEFALAQDVTFAAGTDLATIANTAFVPTDLTRKYTVRTVTGVPVYSVQGVSEVAAGDIDSVNATDLFRAGIGAGTALPSIIVTASTGLLDGAAANGGPVLVLNSAGIDTRYQSAIDATLPGAEEVDNVEIIASARTSDAIQLALLANAGASSAVSTGRGALTRPPIGTNLSTALGSVAPGVGANRGDRNDYCYPHFVQNIPEIAELDPTAAISSPNILIGADAAMATVQSLLPPENNPGQSTQEIISGGLLAFIRSLEPGLTTANQPTKFTMANYISMKAGGIAGLRRDPRISEWIFQSGVTSVLPSQFPSLAPIKRRRMADYIQDSLATIALSYNKKPNTTDRYDSLVGDLTDFLEQLLSTNNPPAQRIAGYTTDSKSGNTALLQGSGIRVVLIAVQTLDSMDDIVLQTTIGETVTVQASPF